MALAWSIETVNSVKLEEVIHSILAGSRVLIYSKHPGYSEFFLGAAADLLDMVNTGLAVRGHKLWPRRSGISPGDFGTSDTKSLALKADAEEVNQL